MTSTVYDHAANHTVHEPNGSTLIVYNSPSLNEAFKKATRR